MARSSRLVTGKFVTYTVDGPDADTLPDEVPVVGLVVQLTPSVDKVSELAVPQTAFLRSYTGVTNSAGVLVSPDGTTGVRVPVTSPENFTYNVLIVPPDGSYAMPYSFSVLIPADSGNFDLTAAIPVSPTPEQDFTQWLAVVAQVTALRDQAAASVASVPTRVAEAIAADNTPALAAAAAINTELGNQDILQGGDSRIPADVDSLVRWARSNYSNYAVPFKSENGVIMGGIGFDGVWELLKLKGSAGNGYEGATVSNKRAITAVGDSLTEGYSNGQYWPADSWPTKLGTLNPNAMVTNLGWSGCMMDEVAIRLGALPITSQASVTVPTSGSVTFTSQSGIGWHDTADRTIHGKLGSVPGNLTHVAGAGTSVSFTPDSGAGGSTVPAGTSFVSDNYTHEWSTLIIGGGRNNISRGVKGDNSTISEHVVAGTVRIVNWMKAQNKRFLLWGTLNASGERTGSTNYNIALTINNSLKELYPNVFIDVRGWLVREAIYEQGKTPTAADLTNINGDAPPMSVMDDSVHFSKASATGIAALMNTALERRDWKA